MLKLHLPLAMVIMLMGWIGAPGAQADNNDAARKEVERMWDPNRMMEQAARNISRRYNLNERQYEETREMLVNEVTEFLDTHPEVWPLIRDLARYQVEGRVPRGPVAARLADKAIPLLDEIKSAIVDANMRWRNTLSDDQKRVHDFDLNDINRTFKKMNENFSEFKEGNASETPLFPKPDLAMKQPALPQKPQPDFYKPATPTADRQKPQEDWWDEYVQTFITDHDLDESQSEAARSILRECKARARDYRMSNARQFSQASMRLKEARRPNSPPKMLEAWQKVEKSLNKPILELFEELKTRLDAIPTDAQRIPRSRRSPTAREIRRTKDAEKKTDTIEMKPLPKDSASKDGASKDSASNAAAKTATSEKQSPP